jgi:ribosomal protein S4
MFKSLHNIAFTLPLYGFLFLTSYYSFSTTQSRLLTTQKYSFLYLNDFKKLLFGKFNKINVFNKFFFQTKKWKHSQIFSTLEENSNSSDLLHYFNCSYRSVFQSNKTKNSLNNENFNMIRIKFKPGYSRLWRVARTSLKFLLNLKFTYQKKLTRYLVKFFRLNRLLLLKYNELKLNSILTATSLVPDRENASLLISNNLVFVNGSLVRNPTFLIFKNDFLQLLISVKYYILFKWLKNFQLIKRKRLGKFISNVSLNKLNKDKKKPRVTFPTWTLNALIFNYDVPKFLEVDFLTLSVFCLYEPFLPQDFNHSLWNLEKTSIYNLYNWKYIT